MPLRLQYLHKEDKLADTSKALGHEQEQQIYARMQKFKQATDQYLALEANIFSSIHATFQTADSTAEKQLLNLEHLQAQPTTAKSLLILLLALLLHIQA